jgi:hypothetical protein
MKKNKTDQVLQECTAWERLLDFFKQENSYLKTRLSEVLDNKTDKDFLALAEHFQNQFILKDEFIDEMLHDVREQERNLHILTDKKATIEERLIKKQQKVRNEMEFLEKDFNRMKNEFNKYLVSVL